MIIIQKMNDCFGNFEGAGNLFSAKGLRCQDLGIQTARPDLARKEIRVSRNAAPIASKYEE
jgi:hypothetical protein